MAQYQIIIYGGPESPRSVEGASLVEAALKANVLLPKSDEYPVTLRAVFEKRDGKFGDVPRNAFEDVVNEIGELEEAVKPIAAHVLGLITGIHIQN